MIRHLNRDHQTINTRGKWPCIICQKTFTRRNTLKRHTISIHQEIFPDLAPILCKIRKISTPTSTPPINYNINPSNVRFRVIAAPRLYIFRAKFIPKGREMYYLEDGQPNPAISLPRRAPTNKFDYASRQNSKPSVTDQPLPQLRDPSRSLTVPNSTQPSEKTQIGTSIEHHSWTTSRSHPRSQI